MNGDLIGVCVLAVFAVALFARRWRLDETGNAVSEIPTREVNPNPDPDRPSCADESAVSLTIEGKAFVVDGDTLRIKGTSIRLFGIDAPELDHPYGIKAKYALVSLCKGQTVRAAVSGTDDHDRTVAQCFLPDGRDLSAEMVRIGLAIDWPKFSRGAYGALEQPGVRKKLWLADARQKGHMHVWKRFEGMNRSRPRSSAGPATRR